ncbi:Ribosomal RNA small subunit methyltransferase G [Legionella massiliensis]|uniref:Ribosomal RNA small subunit methyltransferase G n=1 Tax=Legionella massiliensis TaxID=1034943 RepID=A0A078KTN9_9GAMM|nr:16S rRNA (guanine(527)-N(7))-methyltransferase RsmG [Legionella massiliensis]CDZ76332.1 Ribosomal RNA small subunit methyltransferase G [Legionella massiliensis]CEE12070.1 Ribosomal RNA small subunit methyltransferase G [Legionella massiliensis]
MSSAASLEELLSKGLEQLGLALAANPLMSYLLLLQKWNKTYNLTAVRDLDVMITRHLFDSLAILPWIRGKHVLDVGTGAGFPGIPLALAKPDTQFVLLDSNGKKTRFLQEIKRRLQLDNVEVIQSRAENYHPSVDFDTVTSRAFSELAQMLKWTHHLIGTNGIWLAMKGRYPETELASISLPYQVHPYTVPGLDGERCCVIIENATKE